MKYIVKHLYTGLSYTSPPSVFDEVLTKKIEEFQAALPKGSRLVNLSEAGGSISGAYHLSTWAIPEEESDEDVRLLKRIFEKEND